MGGGVLAVVWLGSVAVTNEQTLEWCIIHCTRITLQYCTGQLHIYVLLSMVVHTGQSLAERLHEWTQHVLAQTTNGLHTVWTICLHWTCVYCVYCMVEGCPKLGRMVPHRKVLWMNSSHKTANDLVCRWLQDYRDSKIPQCPHKTWCSSERNNKQCPTLPNEDWGGMYVRITGWGA